MTPEVYVATVDTSLEEAVANMAQHKYGSAVVVGDGRVVGMFTTIDALNALVLLLREQKSAGAPSS